MQSDEYYIKNKEHIREEYTILKLYSKEYSIEEVFSMYETVRDSLQDKGYGLVNFCNHLLIIDREDMGYYNGMSGMYLPMKYLHKQLVDFGLECFFRRDYRRSSEAVIIFIKNYDWVALDYLDDIEVYVGL